MNTPSVPNASLAIDVKGLSDLKRAAKDNSPEALRATAKQFEAVLINIAMKSMRDATLKDEASDSEQGKTYQSMFDQQLAQAMSNRGIGLADALVRQLSKTQGSLPTQTADPLPAPTVSTIGGLPQAKAIGEKLMTALAAKRRS